jgi:hypothetical protein
VPKLLNILAASVGGGIMLGAGIRLGEAIVGRDGQVENKLVVRLGALEERLGSLEAGKTDASSDTSPAWTNGKDIGKPEKQAVDTAAIRGELAKDDRRVAALNEIAVQLRTEMRGWLEESVTARMAEAESKLRAEADRGREELLEVFTESVQTRVIQRISRLETEVAGQSAAMNELRDCSLRTEQSLQKLLGGLDRILVPRPNPPLADVFHDQQPQETGSSVAPETVSDKAVEEALPEALPPSPPPPEIEPKPRRWSLFG